MQTTTNPIFLVLELNLSCQGTSYLQILSRSNLVPIPDSPTMPRTSAPIPENSTIPLSPPNEPSLPEPTIFVPPRRSSRPNRPPL